MAYDSTLYSQDLTLGHTQIVSKSIRKVRGEGRSTGIETGMLAGLVRLGDQLFRQVPYPFRRTFEQYTLCRETM